MPGFIFCRDKREAEQNRVDTRRILLGTCAVFPAITMIVATAFVVFYLADRDTIRESLGQSYRMNFTVHLWVSGHLAKCTMEEKN